MDPAWAICIVDDAISVDFRSREDGARCKALTASLTDVHFQAIGERRADDEPLMPRKMTGWSTS